MKQTIRITCETKARLEPEKLTPMQGQLKGLDKKHYAKLRESLLRHGFAFPEYAWKSGKTNYVLDGTQRLRALGRMKQEGIELEGGKVPVVFVHAKNKKHAAELILAASSAYGRMSMDSAYEFIAENELEWPEVKAFADLENLNMGTLEKGWFDDGFEPGEGNGEGKENECPKCGHRW